MHRKTQEVSAWPNGYNRSQKDTWTTLKVEGVISASTPTASSVAESDPEQTLESPWRRLRAQNSRRGATSLKLERKEEKQPLQPTGVHISYARFTRDARCVLRKLAQTTRARSPKSTWKTCSGCTSSEGTGWKIGYSRVTRL